MAKAIGYDDSSLEIPAAWEALIEKILRWFDNQMYPVWGMFFAHGTRRAKAANAARTYMPASATAWNALAGAVKVQWATAAAFGTLNNYQLFLSDYSWRKKNTMSLPGTPNAFHQLMGLRILNPGGAINVRWRRDDVDLVGQVTTSFSYKKVENAPTGDQPFKFLATLYYFEDGTNKTETHTWSAGVGNKAWQTVSETYGTANRKYFHQTLVFSIDGYDAEIDLDRLLVADNNGDIYRESWQFKVGRVWDYDSLYRKTGWIFTPEYHVPYFDVIYNG